MMLLCLLYPEKLQHFIKRRRKKSESSDFNGILENNALANKPREKLNQREKTINKGKRKLRQKSSSEDKVEHFCIVFEEAFFESLPDEESFQ